MTEVVAVAGVHALQSIGIYARYEDNKIVLDDEVIETVDELGLVLGALSYRAEKLIDIDVSLPQQAWDLVE